MHLDSVAWWFIKCIDNYIINNNSSIAMTTLLTEKKTMQSLKTLKVSYKSGTT